MEIKLDSEIALRHETAGKLEKSDENFHFQLATNKEQNEKIKSLELENG
jgi:hypothetical protein